MEFYALLHLLLLSHLALVVLALPLHPNVDMQFRDLRRRLDPLRTRPYDVIFHPKTGLCVLRKLEKDPLKLGPCSNSDAWYHTPQNLLMVKGTYFCLQAFGGGQQAKLTIRCSPRDSAWAFVPSSGGRTQLMTALPGGAMLCLDATSDGTVISVSCRCLEDSQPCDSSSQWFEFVDRGNPVGSELVINRNSAVGLLIE